MSDKEVKVTVRNSSSNSIFSTLLWVYIFAFLMMSCSDECKDLTNTTQCIGKLWKDVETDFKKGYGK